MKYNLAFIVTVLILSLSLSAEIRLELVSSTTRPYNVNSIDWCQDCSFLAAGGQDATPEGVIQPFLLNQTTNILSPVGSLTPFDTTIYMISWRNDCRYIAAVGTTISGKATVQVYYFDSAHPGSFTTVGLPWVSSNNFDEFSIDWCSDSNIIGLAGFEFSHEIGTITHLELLSFDETASTLTLVGDPITIPRRVIDTLQWCGNNCQYLAVAGDFLAIYEFDRTTYELTPTCYATDIPRSTQIYTLDWCSSCSYIAIGGMDESNQAFAAVYQFDLESETCLNRIAMTSIQENNTWINSLAWCDCNHLAMIEENVDTDASQLLLLYAFNPTRGLSLLQAFDTGITGFSLSWCGDCDYLALGGAQIRTKSKTINPGIINLYQTIFC